MKVLITGGAGFIGSHTADLLLSKGYQVRILDSLESPVHQRCDEKPAYISDEAEFLIGDVRSRDDLEKALRGVEAVFHLAAYQDYLTDFSRFAFVNDGGTSLLYEIIVNERFPIRKVILGSSQSIYGEGRYRCTEHGIQYPPPRSLTQLENSDWDIRCPLCGKPILPLATDEGKVNPHNPYAVSKYSQELYALTIGKRYGIPTVALRYSITQGPRQSFFNAYSGVLRSFVVRMFNNLPAVIYEDGNQLRDYVSVDDVARANLLALENGAVTFDTFNVGGDRPITVLDYFKRLSGILGKETKPQIDGQFRFGDTRHVFSDIAKIKACLVWEPLTPLEKVIEQYIAWANSQPDVKDYYTTAAQAMKKMGVIRNARRVR